MALDATIGGVNANSYVPQDAANSYFADRLDAADWSSASTGTKDAALITATTRLEAESYEGSRVFLNQRLQWPRYGATDRDGVWYAGNIIPLPVQQATFELALALLRSPTMLGSQTGLEQFINVKVGSLDVTPRAIAGAALPSLVERLLAPVRLGGSGTPVVRA